MSSSQSHPIKVVTNIVSLLDLDIFGSDLIDGSPPKFKATVIIPKDDAKTIWEINGAIDSASKTGIRELRCPITKVSSTHSPLRDGDTECEEQYHDSFFLHASSVNVPKVVDHSLTPIINKTAVHSGCRARVSLLFSALMSNGIFGIVCELGNIQIVQQKSKRGGYI